MRTRTDRFCCSLTGIVVEIFLVHGVRPLVPVLKKDPPHVRIKEASCCGISCARVNQRALSEWRWYSRVVNRVIRKALLDPDENSRQGKGIPHMMETVSKAPVCSSVTVLWVG